MKLKQIKKGMIVTAVDEPTWGECIVVDILQRGEVILQEKRTDKVIRHYAMCVKLREGK